MKELKVYNPFNTKDYYILEKDNKKYFLYRDLELELSADGYIPKSGLLFDMVLSEKTCKDKKVLDLGCGYLGILSLIAYMNGAKKVEAIDYDNNCVEWFNKIISDNNLVNIKCFNSNYFQNIDRKDFDLILANPPQMPMTSGLLHDSGGRDGRKFILEILENSYKYLKEDGNIYMLLFDFLGINQKTNEYSTIIELAEDIGYKDFKVMYETYKEIKEGGVTYQNIPYIKTIYPNYEFYQGQQCKCKMQVLKIGK